MAANEIKLTLRVNDDNTLSIVGKKAKDAASSTDKLKQSTDKLNKSRGNYHKQEKALTQGTLSQGRAMSKLNQTIGSGSSGLVAAYAVLAANVFAATAAFGVLQRAASLDQLQAGLIAVGNIAGQNLPVIAKQLKEITGAAVSTEQAMKATALAMSAGFSSVQLKELTLVAKGASLALGRDMGDALDRLVRGTAKLEPEILDELGIMVRLDEAVANYALSLGRADNTLSQFERRQAFLNATIEQGSKKFSEIANVVDVNPFDKLAAAFSDLTKTITKALANALTPLVEFLSSNPNALLGAILALSQSVVRQLAPAITDMVNRANKASAIAIANSRKAGTVITKRYKALSAEINQMSFRPPSVRKLAADFEAGAVGADVITKRLSTVQGMITKRRNQEKAFSTDSTLFSQERINQIKEERRQLELLQRKLLDVKNAEDLRQGISPRGERLKASGRMRRRTGVALEAMDAAGPIDAAGIALKTAGKNITREFKNANGILNTTAAMFRATAESGKLLGSAFIRLLPVLGSLMVVFDMLKPLFGDLFKKSKITEATEEAEDRFKSFTTIAFRLSRVIEDDTVPAFDKLFAQMKAQVGVFDQIISLAFDVQEKHMEKILENMNDSFLKLSKARESLRSAEGTLARLQETPQGVTQRDIREAESTVLALRANVASLQNEYDNLQKSARTIDAESTVASLQVGLDLLKAQPQLSENVEEEISRLQDVIAKVSNQQITTPEELRKALQKVNPEIKKQVAAVENAQDAYRLFSKETQAFGQKQETTFSRTADFARNMANELRDAGPNGVQKLGHDMKAMKKDAERLSEELKAQGIAVQNIITMSMGDHGIVLFDSEVDMEDAFRKAGDQIDLLSDKIGTSATRQKALNTEIKKMSQFSKENRFFAEQELDTIEKLRVERIADLNNQIKRNKLMGGSVEQRSKLEAEITRLQNEKLDPLERENTLQTALMNGLKRIVDLKKKSAELELQVLDAVDKQNKAQVQMAQARLGMSTRLNPRQEADLAKRTADERGNKEKEIFEQRIQATNLEFELLALKFDLERMRMENTITELYGAGKNDKKFRESMDRVNSLFGEDGAVTKGLDRQRQASIRQIMAEYGLDVSDTAPMPTFNAQTGTTTIPDDMKDRITTQSDINALLKEEAASAFERNRAQEQFSTITDRIEATGNKSAALARKEAAAKKERIRLDELIAKTKEAEVDKDFTQAQKDEALKDLALKKEKALTEEVKARIAERNAETELIKKLAGETAGAFASFTNTIFNAAEDGGALDPKNAEATLGEKFAAFREASEGIIENLRSIGPEGEISAAVVEGAMFVSETMITTFEGIEKAGNKMAATLGAVFSTAAAGINAISNIMAAKSRQQTGVIDEQIRAEQERDGQSAKSVAKIKALEGRKEAIARKAFEQNKKLQMASVVASTAAAIMQVWANPLDIALGKPIAKIMTGFLVGLGAAQLAAIASTSYSGGGSSSTSAPTGPTAVSMGSRGNSVDVGRRAGSGELAYLRGARGMGTGPSDFIGSAFYGKKMRAVGGAVAGYTVGEQGPELFVPEVPGTIVPNDDVAMGQNVNVSFNVQAIDASSFNDALTEQRGNIIEIIREAANSSGEGFLESVDTQSLV